MRKLISEIKLTPMNKFITESIVFYKINYIIHAAKKYKQDNML